MVLGVCMHGAGECVVLYLVLPLSLRGLQTYWGNEGPTHEQLPCQQYPHPPPGDRMSGRAWSYGRTRTQTL